MSKKIKQPQQPLSPKKYVMTRTRALPFYKCLINNDWEDSKIASIVVLRKHNNDHITAGFYLVDLLARGVKDTHYFFNEPEWELQERIPDDIYIEIPYVLAHNIIYGAVVFAEDFDMHPHKDFAITQYILEEDTDDIELLDIEFGIDGKPGFIEVVDDDIDDDENDFPDFSTFTDENWCDYFSSLKEEENSAEFEEVVDVLFEKWYSENNGLSTPSPDIEKVTYDPINDHFFKNEEEHNTSNEIYRKLTHESPDNPKAIREIEKQLHEMIRANPDNPVYYNYLTICAQYKKDKDKTITIMEDTLKKFPDYLFAKTNYCLLLMQNNQFEEAASIWGEYRSLQEIYPHKKEFHASEILSLHSCMLSLALEKDDMLKAKYHYDILCELDHDYLDRSDFFISNEIEFEARKLKTVMRYIEEKGYADVP